MVFPAAKYDELEQQAEKIKQEKEDLLLDTNILKSKDGSDFYLPKDKERANLILQTIEDIKVLKQQFIKDEIDPMAQNGLIRDLITERNLTYEELTGQYQSTTGAKVKSFTNSLNRNIVQNLDNFIASFLASSSNATYICFTFFSTNLFTNVLLGNLPNKGITFLLIDIASNTPSHKTIGSFQFINISKHTVSFDIGGFLYLNFEFGNISLAIK